MIRWGFVLAPLPALLLGMFTMRQAGVPAALWLLNLAAAIVGLLLVAGARSVPPASRPSMHRAIAIGSLAIIALPFASQGMLGVHRWVAIGGFRLHVAAIVAPLLLASLAAIGHARFAIAIAVLTTTILALQPDAAQATSFAAACIVLLAFGHESRLQRTIGIALLLAAAALALLRPDPLAPVPYVEGIYAMVASRGSAWAILGAASLILLPLPFFATFLRMRDRLALALGIYIGMTILAAFWGTFPVPVMGYGVSPILGYCIALAQVRPHHGRG